ncbi:MAG: T9SS type A sorting domain-containing protein [bacterium]|nr:T9SS type A sorting domain-containing protein [bacterium]
MRQFSLSIFFFICFHVAFSQSFTLTPRMTSAQGTVNEVTDFYMDVVNLTNQPLQLTVSYQRINLPTPWIVNLCVGEACYPDFMTSVPLTLSSGARDSVALGIFPTSGGAVGIASLTVSQDNTTFSITIPCTLTVSSNTIQRDAIPTSTFLTYVYPNPFNSHSTLVLQLNQRETVRLRLYDLRGREIYSTQQTFASGLTLLDLSPFFKDTPSGTYLLQVDGRNSRQIHRLQFIR